MKKGFDTSARTDWGHGFDTHCVPCPELVEGSARTGADKGFDRLSPNGGKEFGSGRFGGRSTNSPSLLLALRVLRFARSEIVLRPQKPPILRYLRTNGRTDEGANGRTGNAGTKGGWVVQERIRPIADTERAQAAMLFIAIPETAPQYSAHTDSPQPRQTG